MSILNNLNEKQKKAAEIIDGQSLIIAGAGSGKTRTITYKIAYMIKEKNIDPSNILAVTFTNKAAKEMKERIQELIGINSDITISTFHSFAVKLLRNYANKLGYTSNFTIYDNNDQKTIIKRVLKNTNFDFISTANLNDTVLTANDFGTDGVKVNSLIKKINRFKEFAIEYSNLHTQINLDNQINYRFYEIFKEYQEVLIKSNAFDFSDLLLNAYKLLEDPYILNKIQEKYKYVLIDEYQDTNEIQYKIVNKIVSKYKNLCVVGDEDQSIYAFRGANIQNILNFEKDYPNAKIIKLEQNYRSYQNILSAANSVIKNNTSSKGKTLWSDKGNGEKIFIFKANNTEEEAEFLINHIKTLVLNKNKKYSDITILYRMNRQSRSIEDKLIKNNIPYKIFGGLNFYDRREIKDLISYLLLINNIQDNLAFERIINVPKRGLGNKTLEKIENIATINSCSLFEALNYIDGHFTDTITKKLKSFKNIIDNIIIQKEILSTSEILEIIINEINYYDYISILDEAEIRIENINELLESIEFIEKTEGIINLNDYIENISLNLNFKNENFIDENYVKLMTVHSSKGLEFNTVFFIGVNYELEDIEEERRIFYVALTRAKELVYLSYSPKLINFLFETADKFIEEIDTNLLQEIYNPNFYYNNNYNSYNFEKKRTYVENFNPIKNPVSINGYKKGAIVNHKKYGLGKIKDIDEKSITISFDDGIKKIALILADKFLKKED